MMNLTSTDIIAKMDEYELEQEAKVLLDLLEEKSIKVNSYISLDPRSLGTDVDNIEKIVRKLGDVCHYWNIKRDERSSVESATDDVIESATAGKGENLYVVEYGLDFGGPEDGPVVKPFKEFFYAKSEEDAMRKFEASGICDDVGYCGGSAHKAAGEELQNYEKWKQADREFIRDYLVDVYMNDYDLVESEAREVADACLPRLEEYNGYAFDDLPGWITSGGATYWMDDYSRDAFEKEDYPNKIINQVYEDEYLLLEKMTDEDGTVWL